ncbi:MAG: Ig domain-containing protein [Clostridia bacterium]|nr:Ig domain-containing protein [Clostridia bacterium]
MPTYIQDFDYTLHTSLRITHRLKVTEEPDIPNQRTKFTISVLRSNSGRFYYGENQYLKLEINGSVVYDGTKHIKNLGENASDEIFTQTHYVKYVSDNAGSFEIKASYKSEEQNLLIANVYLTIASATVTGTLTPIDLSSPQISGLSVKADRYGLNASASFTAKHSSYDLTLIEFKLSGLTHVQARHRYGTHSSNKNQGTFTNKQDYGSNADGTCWFSVSLVRPIGQSKTVNFDLDDRLCEPPYSLDSGGSYPWELTVTALNGKQAKVSGTLNVPQKVTGVSCENQLEISLGQTTVLEYQVYPDNAEYPAVVFSSSDPSVATVDENTGVITAVNDGMCQITVTTLDGGSPDAVSGFSASCVVNVINTDVFPKLSEIRYLTIREISRLSFACTFLRDKLSDKGVSVPELAIVFCEGKSHPVKEIKSLLETIESNCQLLKSASSSLYPTSSLAGQMNLLNHNEGYNWLVIVNEWITFLNELNTQIEKEA